MKIKVILILSLLVVSFAGTLVTAGCGSKSEPEAIPAPGPAEKAGAALDKVVEQSGDAASKLAEKTREVAEQTSSATKAAASKAMEKTGEALEKTGAAMEKTGAEMQNGQTAPKKP
ncbi:MAG: hypothetical protein WA705_06635 [Candidatus Ozemobacteraceae bacterium]